MEQVGKATLWSFLDGSDKCQQVTNFKVRGDQGSHVANYRDLASKVAELQWRNRGYVMLFRGQSGDWRSVKKLTMLRPTIFRPLGGKKTLAQSVVEKRFAALLSAEAALAAGFQSKLRTGRDRVAKERLLRWAILQHYEVCATPLLDVSQSLRIAASFGSATMPREAYLFVLAVPHITGAITAHAESGLQILRLSSVCPPAAIRPHIQEGYLLGEYPELIGIDQAKKYSHYEMDFGRRIVAKFRFNPASFWSDATFPVVPQEALYPQSKDWLETLTGEIKTAVSLL